MFYIIVFNWEFVCKDVRATSKYKIHVSLVNPSGMDTVQELECGQLIWLLSLSQAVMPLWQKGCFLLLFFKFFYLTSTSASCDSQHVDPLLTELLLCILSVIRQMSLPSQWDQKRNKKIQGFFKSSVVIAVSLSFKETAVKPFVFLVPLLCLKSF